MDAERIRNIAKDPSQLKVLKPREFEEFVAAVLSSLGWDVQITPQTRDGGFDIFATSKDQTGLETTWVVECKSYGEDRKVGIELLRQLYGIKSFLGVSNGLLVTSSTFTPNAESFAKQLYDLKLVDHTGLLLWLEQLRRAETPPTAPQPSKYLSCFISHSHRDHEFAQNLTVKLREHGVRTWFAPEDLGPGQKIHEEIHKAIDSFDKLIIVLSESSIMSTWVQSELRRARRREVQQNSRILLPIGLMSFERLRSWECFDADTGKDIAVELREYFIPCIEQWRDPAQFESLLTRVLQALKRKTEH